MAPTSKPPCILAVIAAEQMEPNKMVQYIQSLDLSKDFTSKVKVQIPTPRIRAAIQADSRPFVNWNEPATCAPCQDLQIRDRALVDLHSVAEREQRNGPVQLVLELPEMMARGTKAAQDLTLVLVFDPEQAAQVFPSQESQRAFNNTAIPHIGVIALTLPYERGWGQSIRPFHRELCEMISEALRESTNPSQELLEELEDHLLDVRDTRNGGGRSSLVTPSNSHPSIPAADQDLDMDELWAVEDGLVGAGELALGEWSAIEPVSSSMHSRNVASRSVSSEDASDTEERSAIEDQSDGQSIVGQGSSSMRSSDTAEPSSGSEMDLDMDDVSDMEDDSTDEEELAAEDWSTTEPVPSTTTDGADQPAARGLDDVRSVFWSTIDTQHSDQANEANPGLSRLELILEMGAETVVHHHGFLEPVSTDRHPSLLEFKGARRRPSVEFISSRRVPAVELIPTREVLPRPAFLAADHPSQDVPGSSISTAIELD